MNYHSSLVRFFILAPILPGGIMLYVIFRRKLYRDSPWFTIYLAMIVVCAPALFYLYQFPPHPDNMDYFCGAWIYNGWTITIAFMFILDIFRCLMKDYASIRRTGIAFMTLVAIGLSVAAIAVAHWGVVNGPPLTRTLLSVERSIRILQVGFILGIFTFSSFMGLTWRHQIFGVALGYGLFAATSLTMLAYVSHFGAGYAYRALIVEQFAYIMTLLTWVIYVLEGEPARKVVVPAASREQLEHWNQALAGVGTQSVASR
jgi:hypothetical protein